MIKKKYGDLKAGDKFKWYGVLYLMTEACDVSTAYDDDELHECCMPVSTKTGKYGISALMPKGDDTLVNLVKIKETKL